jgi:rare lipoprotein A
MIFKNLILGIAFICLTACSTSPVTKLASGNFSSEENMRVTSSPRVIGEGGAVPKGGGKAHVGKSYSVAGRTYTPFEKTMGHTENGMASWYGKQFHGRKTANGEIFDMHSVSAAHKTMPLPSYARVTNAANGKSIIVRVNDRGPFAHNRLIDLSSRTADLLDFKSSGHVKVKVEYVGAAPISGTDDRKLEATLRSGVPATLPGDRAIMVASNAPVAIPKLALEKPKIPDILKPLPELKEEPVVEQEQPKPRGLFAALQQGFKPTPLEDEKPLSLSLKPGSHY